MINRGMRVFNNAVQQYQLYTDNAEKIKAKKQENEFNIKTQDLEYKTLKADLDLKKQKGDMNELAYKDAINKLSFVNKMNKKIAEGKSAAQDVAEYQTQEKIGQMSNLMSATYNYFPSVKQFVDQTIAVEQVNKSLGQSYAGENLYSAEFTGNGVKVNTPKKEKYKDSKDYLVNQSSQDILKTLISNEYDDRSVSEKVKESKRLAKEIHYGKIESKESTDKYKKGETKNFGAKGNWKYLGNDQWEKVD